MTWRCYQVTWLMKKCRSTCQLVDFMHTGRLDKGELVVDGSAVEDGPVKVDDVDDRVDFFSIHS